MRNENEILEIYGLDADAEEVYIACFELAPGRSWYELTRGEKKATLIRALVKLGMGNGTYIGRVVYNDWVSISTSPIYFVKRGE